MDLKSLEIEITRVGDEIKAKKAQNVEKSLLKPFIDELLALKEKYKELEKSSQSTSSFDRAAFDSLLTKRFFIAPSFEIYGGVAGLFDYGPAGCSIQNNILSLWRQHFVVQEDMLEIECTNLTPEEVLKTSGHVERFADYMVKDTGTGDIFRADHLVKNVLTHRLDNDCLLLSGKAPKKTASTDPIVPLDRKTKTEYETVLESLDNYQGAALEKLINDLDIRNLETNNKVSAPVLFNLMFETQIGPTGQFKAYMRPETAQGHFINFKRLLESNNEGMPFASASIGKSFRNEIAPRQGLLRVREFTMAEIEHFVHPERKNHASFATIKDLKMPLYSKQDQLAAKGSKVMTIGEAVAMGMVNNETLGYFMARIYLFLVKIGIDPERIRFRQHMDNELAHYASDCWDADIKSSYGWIESVGCADRAAYDLTVHSKRTNTKLIARDVLATPITETGLVISFIKSKFGPAFGKDSKKAMAIIEDYQTAEIEEFKKSMDAEQFVVIKGNEGESFKITSDMVKITEQTKKISVVEYTPSVIEPSFGIGRIIYALLEHSYYTRSDDIQKAVFKFTPQIAPTKVLICPLSKNVVFEELVGQVTNRLRKAGYSCKIDDSSGSIGRRYARNDEMGTPFAITVDFESVKDGSVTLRERDSTSQVRVSSIDIAIQVVGELIEETRTWANVVDRFGIVPPVKD